MPQSPNSTYSRSINFFASFLISSNVMEVFIPEMSLDEINAEILAVRAERKR